MGDDPRLRAQVDDLEAAIDQFAMLMDALASKRVFYQSYNIAASRSAPGKARRTGS